MVAFVPRARTGVSLWHGLALLVGAVALVLVVTTGVTRVAHAADSDIRITEWMYDGTGGEFVELTNVGAVPVDMAGWKYHDSGADFALGFDLSGFGTVEPGESVVFTDAATAAAFRTTWNLCSAIKVVAGSTPGLGRNDAINIYNSVGDLVDTLEYGDQDFPGTIRTQGASGWVSAAGLGANDPSEWTLSTVEDAEGSYAATGGAIGSPGKSTRATVAYEPCDRQIRITEWMYDGTGGEFVELTNVGNQPVDMTGWKYHDSGADFALGFDLSGFGTVEPGESVVFTDAGTAAAFRTTWSLCDDIKVIAASTPGLGRNDAINIYNAGGEVVDTLAYGDQDFPGTIRTQGASGWVSAAGLGADDPTEWTLSTVDDAEGSYAATGGAIGSPGTSTRATVAFEPCEDEGGDGEDEEETFDIRITEWMYDGAGGEWVELTNVGDTPVDLAGWTYDDDSRDPTVGFDLSGFGTVQPGESVVFVESDPASAFREDWNLCSSVKVIGPYTNNLGRADEINIFDGEDNLVDRLTYGDQAFPGSIRTTGASGWVSAAGLGMNDVFEWTLATVGDDEDSYASTGGAIGSPGRSTRATVPYDPCARQIRITEWMYDGAGGEWVELTNVGNQPVDLTGWAYDDDSADPSVGFDLSGFGTVQPGESVVFVEIDPASFRVDWDLCADLKVIGPYTNNLGRADQINIFDSTDSLVDRLTYGDQVFLGSIRTTQASGWVSAAGLGADDVFEWTLATVDDAEDSYESTGGAIGSPGKSTRATVAFDPCEEEGGGGGEGDAPTIAAGASVVIGSIGDPQNPTLTLTVADTDTDLGDLAVTVVSSSAAGVLPLGNVSITGAGATRSVTFTPTGRGTSTVVFRVTDPEANQDEVTVTYASSNARPDSSGRYHHGISDASAALDVGGGYMLLVNDETNTIFLYHQTTTGAPEKTWLFTTGQLGIDSEGDEVDFEGIARSGNLVVITGSHGNNREGEVREERRTFIGATISGSGASTELTFLGRYNGLWDDLLEWDAADGHGLGADALGLVAAAAPSVLPNPPDGFNIEALEFAPDNMALYLGFRAPTIDGDALIVPVLNVEDLFDGPGGIVEDAGVAQFGDPILLDLGGRSIRAMAKNASNQYLISAGPSPANPGWALYTWDGEPDSAPQFNRALPAEDPLTGGVWESIVSVPATLAGGQVRLVTDSGDTNFYGTGETKDLAPAFQKSYSQAFTLAGGASSGGGGSTPTPTPPRQVSDEGVTAEVERQEEVPVGATGDTNVAVEGSRGSVQVTAPQGALPAGSTLVVSALAAPEDLAQQAPPPGNVSLVLPFAIQATAGDGSAITELGAPVSIVFTVPAAQLSDDVNPEALLIAYWNGSEWVVVESTVTVNADGSLELSVTVDHFTVFAVFNNPDWGTFTPAPAASGISLGVWGGGPIGQFPTAKSYWVSSGGQLVGYVVGAPAFVNTQFAALYPNGTIPLGTVLIAVR